MGKEDYRVKPDNEKPLLKDYKQPLKKNLLCRIFRRYEQK